MITIGVAIEAYTTFDDLANSLVALNFVVPVTGFMLSLANWYFVRMYKNRKIFSDCSALITLGITTCAYIWTVFHYEEKGFADIFRCVDFAGFLDVMQGVIFFLGIGFLLTLIFCVLSKTLSNKYAEMLGKE